MNEKEVNSNRSTIIKQALESYLDNGFTDKNVIIQKVVEELGVPRPTVRRIARDLRKEYCKKVEILQSEVEGTQ